MMELQINESHNNGLKVKTKRFKFWFMRWNVRIMRENRNRVLRRVTSVKFKFIITR